MIKEIYLDNASTTKVKPEVVREMNRFLLKDYGNPSSINAIGERAFEEINKVREKIAREIGCKTHEIIFTSGTTESNNFAIRNLVKNEGKNKIILSVIEHPSISKSAEYLGKNGFEVKKIGVNKEGILNLKELEKEIDNKTFLVSVMHVNNVFGTIQDLKKIGEICKRKGALFHSDCAQSFGKLLIKVKDWNVDMISASAHKIGGPKGVGFLYIKEGTYISPLFYGGGQEKNLRSGTENVPGIIGFGKALEISKKVNWKKVSELRDYFILELIKLGGKINGPKQENRIYNNIHVSFPNANAEELITKLSQKGIYVSAGSACDSKKQKEDLVLKAIGLTQKEIEGSIRISLNELVTLKDGVFVVKEIKRILSL